MIYNFWTVSLFIILTMSLIYCGRKEYYTEPIANKNSMRYTLTDVNKAYQCILDYFNRTVTIPKVISINRIASKMTLELFIYNIQTNILAQYNIIVNIPLSSKQKCTIEKITEHSKENTIIPKEENRFEKVDFYLK